MYKISELAEKVGLSRTALLYYEKLQLIAGLRLENGYRVYNERDLQRIHLIQQLQLGGLTLKECKVCLESKIDKALVKQRLKELDEEIKQKQQSRILLAAIAGEGDLKSWHESLDKLAPDAHLDWLRTQGFSDKEALQLKWLSKDMNDHDIYMQDFMKVFQTLERWGPGSEDDTKHALSLIPTAPSSILEIGCGKGLATNVLAKCSQAQITAIDNEQLALDQLAKRFEEKGLAARLEVCCTNMAELPYSNESYDLIWSEGSAYIIGIEKALMLWKPILKKQGYLMMSDLVWKTNSPSEQAIEFWRHEYPDIQTVQTRIKQIEKTGYQVIANFSQSKSAWLNYYNPLRERLNELESEMVNSTAFKNMKNEVSICTEFADEFGYHMFILAKV
ncbi:MerR family transcriptional regulator [Pseudoalteromonas sp. MMG005]|uniref:MerR family transcriptional regulator n=1 Tax=Pseudoalteromonas sp. MMG005 TaxID=2822682 RepID=UPI001B3A1A98|nr:MerR family transcriptional regulator [Pseudoalteromonas sp. MMG005]